MTVREKDVKKSLVHTITNNLMVQIFDQRGKSYFVRTQRYTFFFLQDINFEASHWPILRFIESLDWIFQILATLESNLSFWNDVYNSSLLTSEKTKLDSKQQQRFMAKLSEPFLPENQWYYWRHKGFLTSVGILLVSYFLLKFFMGIADSHNY